MPDNEDPIKKPTIDERLEALTQTVELLAAMQVKTEKTINRLGKYIRIIVQDHEIRLATLENDNEE